MSEIANLLLKVIVVITPAFVAIVMVQNFKKKFTKKIKELDVKIEKINKFNKIQAFINENYDINKIDTDEIDVAETETNTAKIDTDTDYFPEETDTEDSIPNIRFMAEVDRPYFYGIDTKLDDSFSVTLLKLIQAKGLDETSVYKRAKIDRRHFSKIRSNTDYTPNKKTVLAFAIALELRLDETNDLLKRAGYALSNSMMFDVVVSYFISNRKYDIIEINEALSHFRL